MIVKRLPHGFFNGVPIKTSSRRYDSHETPISISKEALEGKRQVRVSLPEKGKVSK